MVDSVVGVFLTQNVSDHLSSSAFMSLAARFPVKPSSKYDACHDESASMIVNSPEVQIVEPEENAKLEEILNQSVHELSSMTKDIIEHSAKRETVDSNSIDSCGTTGSLRDESNCKLLEPAQSLAIGTPGISASPLLAEFNSQDGAQGNALAPPSGKSTIIEQPIDRLIKAANSLTPAALRAAVSDIDSVISMNDRKQSSNTFRRP